MDFKKINLGLWITIGFNLLLLGEYLWDQNNAKSVVFLFWMQSLILGAQNIFLMLFARTGLPILMNNKPSTTSFGFNVFMAGFFFVHYGVFLLAFGAIAVLDQKIPGEFYHGKWVFVALILLAIGAVLELPGKIKREREINASLFTLMFIPYIRLVPFVAIWLGGIYLKIVWIFPIFLLLKMGVDLVYYRYMDFRAEKVSNEGSNEIR